MRETDCDVLIIGAGPTGVTLALIAASHGASVTICDREAGIFPLPRAAHVDHEVMRIYQSVGAADAIASSTRTSNRYDFLNKAGDVLLRFDRADQVGPGGWPAANMIHQPSLERFLRDRLPDNETINLNQEWCFLDQSDLDHGVTAKFDTPDGPRTLTASFLVGADGARSSVRESAGIELHDLKFDEPWLVIDAIVHDPDRLPKINLQICDPARPTTCILMGEGRHRWEFMLLPGESPEQVLEDEFISDLLEPWDIQGAITLERKAVYRFNARVAATWCKGRVLLAGDAAHQTPPFAGQGMCAGARDAANLGWKLGMISSGAASPSLLDSYQEEREPHVRATIDMAIMMGRTVCTIDPDVAAERDRRMLAARAEGNASNRQMTYPEIERGLVAQQFSAAGKYFPQFITEQKGVKLDDVLGNEACLIGTEFSCSMQGIAGISLRDPAMAPFANSISDWLKSHDSEAVLIRPDRYVFGAGSPEALIDAWTHRILTGRQTVAVDADEVRSH